MSPRGRLRALAPLLAAGLCLACTTAEPAPSEPQRVATGSERAVQAVSVATLSPQATIEAPPESPASAAAAATSPASDTPAPTASTPTEVSMPSPTAGPAGMPVPPATTSPSVTTSPSSTPTPTATPTPTGTPDASPTPIVAGGVALTPREQWLLDAHNAERLERGIPPLQVDGRLQRIARERATIMADNDLFSHYSPSGETIYDLMAAAGYVYASDATENIHYNDVALSQADVFAMREYMASPPHRANILDPNLVYAGLAMETSAYGVHYYSVVLAD